MKATILGIDNCPQCGQNLNLPPNVWERLKAAELLVKDLRHIEALASGADKEQACRMISNHVEQSIVRWRMVTTDEVN